MRLQVEKSKIASEIYDSLKGRENFDRLPLLTFFVVFNESDSLQQFSGVDIITAGLLDQPQAVRQIVEAAVNRAVALAKQRLITAKQPVAVDQANLQAAPAEARIHARRLAKEERRARRIAQKTAAVRARIEAKTAEKQATVSKLRETQQTLSSVQSKVAQAATRLREARQQRDQVADKLRKAQAQIAERRNRLQEVLQNRERIGETSVLTDYLNHGLAEIERLNSEASQVREVIRALELEIEALAALGQSGARHGELRTQIERVEAELARIRSEIQARFTEEERESSRRLEQLREQAAARERELGQT